MRIGDIVMIESRRWPYIFNGYVGLIVGNAGGLYGVRFLHPAVGLEEDEVVTHRSAFPACELTHLGDVR